MSIQDMLFVLAAVLHVIGIIGSFLPVLPGPPLSLIAMILCCVAFPNPLMIIMTILMAILVIFLFVLDYIAPGIMAKKAGGCKKAEYLANVGLFIGMFFLPWGLVIGPFVGAFLGQALNDKKAMHWRQSFEVALYSLVSIIVTSLFKCYACIIMLIICIVDAIFYYN